MNTTLKVLGFAAFAALVAGCAPVKGDKMHDMKDGKANEMMHDMKDGDHKMMPDMKDDKMHDMKDGKTSDDSTESAK